MGACKSRCVHVCLSTAKSSQNFKTKGFLGSFRLNTCTSWLHFTEWKTKVRMGDIAQRVCGWNLGLLTPSRDIGWSLQSLYLEERLMHVDGNRNYYWWDLVAPNGKYFQVVPVTLGSVQNKGVTVPLHLAWLDHQWMICRAQAWVSGVPTKWPSSMGATKMKEKLRNHAMWGRTEGTRSLRKS